MQTLLCRTAPARLAAALALSLGILATAHAASWFSSPKPHAQLQALYTRLPVAQTQLETAIAMQAQGQSGATARVKQALVELRALGSNCAKLNGCDLAKFFAAYEAAVQLAGSSHSGRLNDADFPVDLESDERLIGGKLPQLHEALTVLKGKELKDVIVLNEPVKAALDEWLTWNRPLLIEAYKNYAYMRPLMLPAYEKAGLPEALLFGILARESVGRVHSVSKSGAMGPLQFMPETGKRFGLTNQDGFDLRLDPKLAAQANVRYLQEQLGKLDNDLALTLAAYNGGEGRVTRLYQEHRRGFFDATVNEALPQETRDYVPRVLAAAYLFLHPEQYNLKFPEVSGATVETELSNSMSLSELTVCLGQTGREEGWFRTLRNLNPRWRPDQRLAAGSKIKIPEAAMPDFRRVCGDPQFMVRIAGLHEARVPIPPGFVPYVIRKGDTLAAIARRSSCVSVSALANFNDIAAPSFAIKPGQKIKVPNCS